jgi:hypothetical protein
LWVETREIFEGDTSDTLEGDTSVIFEGETSVAREGEMRHDFSGGESERGLVAGAAGMKGGGGESGGLDLGDEMKPCLSCGELGASFSGAGGGVFSGFGEGVHVGFGVDTRDGVTVSSPPRSCCPRYGESDRGAVRPKIGSSGSVRGQRELKSAESSARESVEDVRRRRR